ncbi:site-specific tyrosine recombinase XerD [Streptococcus cameli]
MQELISQFLDEKQLALNSKKAYQYDLEQFLEICQEQITPSKLAIYQAFLQDLAPTAQRRKLSTINQFLYFLYEANQLNRFYKLKPAEGRSPRVKKKLPQLEDPSCLWEASSFPIGQVIALLMLEVGLLPNELVSLRVDQFDFSFQVLSLGTARAKRVIPISNKLLPYLEDRLEGQYLFEHKGKPYSRQWFYNRLTEYMASIGKKEWTAQFLRDQYILRELESGKTLDQVAKQLGLTSQMGLEKYR